MYLIASNGRQIDGWDFCIDQNVLVFSYGSTPGNYKLNVKPYTEKNWHLELWDEKMFFGSRPAINILDYNNLLIQSLQIKVFLYIIGWGFCLW